jgi:murein DD-endopeptidase MepM/ murein hydrolase activator NlpD
MNSENQKTKRFWQVIFSFTLVLAIVAGTLPARVQAADLQVTCASHYTVVSGDTLSAIADKYSLTVLELASANDLKDPYPLYVGQSLCIPASSSSSSSSNSSSSSTSTATSAKFTVTRDGNYITIKVNNLPKKSVYYVKIDDAKDRIYKWIKIGLVRMGKNTAITKTIKLPRGARGTDTFNICLKNGTTDALYCEQFYLPAP